MLSKFIIMSTSALIASQTIAMEEAKCPKGEAVADAINQLVKKDLLDAKIHEVSKTKSSSIIKGKTIQIDGHEWAIAEADKDLKSPINTKPRPNEKVFSQFEQQSLSESYTQRPSVKKDFVGIQSSKKICAYYQSEDKAYVHISLLK